MNKDSLIYVAGSSGLVGSAIVRYLISEGYNNIINTKIDLRNQSFVKAFFEETKPEYVFLSAAIVGGDKSK